MAIVFISCFFNSVYVLLRGPLTRLNKRRNIDFLQILIRIRMGGVFGKVVCSAGSAEFYWNGKQVGWVECRGCGGSALFRESEEPQFSRIFS